MRICHVVRQYHPSVGGLETFVARLTAELSDLGCCCDVLTLNRLFRGRDILPPSANIDGVAVRRVPMMGHPRFFLPLFDDAILAPYDVIHVHGVDGMFDRVARYRRRPGQILAATSHGLFFHTPWMAQVKTIYLHTATRLAASRYDIVIANSASDLGRLRAVRADAARLSNGITPLGAFMAEGRDLLCLGRLARHKHVDRVIQALAQPELEDVVLHVVGPEWDVTRLELTQLAERLRVAHRVHLHGHVEQRRIKEIASNCGVFVSASRYEGFGMALIEAMSVGLVPVVQANASFLDLMSEVDCGGITDFAKPRAAAAMIRHALDQLDARARRGAADFASRFSWSAHARSTIELYSQAMRDRAA